MQAAPIQPSAAVQTVARTGTGASNVATIAIFGSHHAMVLVRALASQSAARGACVAGAQHDAAPLARDS